MGRSVLIHNTLFNLNTPTSRFDKYPSPTQAILPVPLVVDPFSAPDFLSPSFSQSQILPLRNKSFPVPSKSSVLFRVCCCLFSFSPLNRLFSSPMALRLALFLPPPLSTGGPLSPRLPLSPEPGLKARPSWLALRPSDSVVQSKSWRMTGKERWVRGSSRVWASGPQGLETQR